MSAWMIAATASLLLMLPLGLVCARSGSWDRLVALQAATGIGVGLFVMLAEGSNRASYDDIALTLALLSFPGTLAFAVTLGHWL